jgi:hypothetical protein
MDRLHGEAPPERSRDRWDEMRWERWDEIDETRWEKKRRDEMREKRREEKREDIWEQENESSTWIIIDIITFDGTWEASLRLVTFSSLSLLPPLHYLFPKD